MGWVLETVPFTKRTHLVSRSRSREGCVYDLGDDGSNRRITDKTSGALVHTTLGDDDKESVRANRIIDVISDTVDRLGLGKEPVAEWRVVVVEDNSVNALYIGGGWISITRGLLGRFDSDAHVAFVLAHEVAHGIARHFSETITVFVERHHKLIPKFLARQPYRRRELEADYVGMMLLAASGVDPQEAFQALDKLAATTGTRKSSFFSPSTHPSWKKRSRNLSRPKVMDKAMQLYTQAISAGAKGFVGHE